MLAELHHSDRRYGLQPTSTFTSAGKWAFWLRNAVHLGFRVRPKEPKVDQTWLLPSSWGVQKLLSQPLDLPFLAQATYNYGQSPICRLNIIYMIELFGKNPWFFLVTYESSMSLTFRCASTLEVCWAFLTMPSGREGREAQWTHGQLGWICGKTLVASSRCKWIYPLVI